MKRRNVMLAVLFLGINVSFAQEPAAKFELISSAFKNNETLPAKYTCQENDINPPLEIKNIPPKTKSMALALESPDAAEGTWVHWVVYDIANNKNVIEENSIPGTMLFNDFGKFNYNGPCLNDTRMHHFVFTVYALDALLDVNEGGILKDLQKAMKGHIIDQATLTASYRNTAM